MSPVSAQCPGCGAGLSFAHDGSVVIVCAHCRSAVARTDTAFEDLGKIAALASLEASFTLGERGVYKGSGFSLVGHTQLRHSKGGMWDEYYAAFDDGRWGWLAQTPTGFYLSFEEKSVSPPAPETLTPGQRLDLVEHRPPFTVEEHGEATYTAAAGELPFRFVAGETLRFADLSGPDGAFATVSRDEDRTTLFAGEKVTLAALELELRATERAPDHVHVERLACPSCGASLALLAPDASLRVVCSYCDALIDTQSGALRFLQAVAPKGKPPFLPLGAEGTLHGVRYKVVGYVRRSIEYEGVRYPWEEFLLREASGAFAWLVASDGHFGLGRQIPAGALRPDGQKRMIFEAREYRLFQAGRARIDRIAGELPWRAEVGEEAATADFVAPPYQLSREATGDETTWTHTVYVTRNELREAFGELKFPPQRGIAPHQPCRVERYGSAWLLLFVIALSLFLALKIALPTRTLFSQRMSVAEPSQTFFTEAFEVRPDRRLEVKVQATPLDNSWVEVQGDLFDENTGLTQPFGLELAYYAGVSGGESWSEGRRADDVAVPPLPKGTYSLRLEAARDPKYQPVELFVEVGEAGPSVAQLLLLLGAITLWPLVSVIRRHKFENERWSNSDYGGSET